MTRMISPVLLSLVKAMVILSVGLKGTNLTILYSSHSVIQVLAKESEETLLYRDMQTDMVQQMLRRLGSAKIPTSEPADASPAPARPQ